MEDAARHSCGGSVTEGAVFDVRGLTTVLLIFLATGALAFDSGAWLKRRADFEKDALRLRAAYTNALAQACEPAEGVNVPLEIHSNGAVKSSIAARVARFFPKEDLVLGDGVVILQRDEHGAELVKIEAEHLLFDRKTRRGWAEGPAKVTRGLTAFSGVNIYFATDEEYVLSFDSSSLFSKDLKAGGAF